MDANKMKPTEQQRNLETTRWKTPEYRKQIVKDCMNLIIKKSQWKDESLLSGLFQHLERYEAKLNATAKTQVEYFNWLTGKIEAICSQLKTPESEPIISNSTGPGGISSAQEAGKSENIEWKEQVYEKVQRIKSTYLPKLTAVYQIMNKKLETLMSSPRAPNPFILENTRTNKKNLECIFDLLRVSKSQITIEFKKKLDQAEKIILFNFPPKNVSSHHQGQPHSSDVQSRQQFGPSHPSISQMELLGAQTSSHALGTQNYHIMKDDSQQNKIRLQEQQAAKQYSNSQQDVNQLVIKKGPGNAVQQQTQQCAQKATEVGVNTRGIPASNMRENYNNHEEFSHKPTINSDEPSAAMQSFLKVLTSISPEALKNSVGDIKELVYLNDQIPTSEFISGPPTMVQQLKPRLVPQSDIHSFSQARYMTCNDFAPVGRKRSHSMNEMTAFETSRICASSCDSFNQLTDAEKPDMTSVASKIKKPEIVENCSLLQEIRDINNLLIDSEIVIGEKDSILSAAGGAAEHGEGLVIKFVFNAVTVNQNLHLSSDKKSIIKPLWLLVPTSYPFSPPVILEMLSEVSEGLGDLSTIAKSNLIYSLQHLNQPRTLMNIATSWERCAREAILEYAQARGGGTFSSIYGGWEMCEKYF
ncbi:mediator of RNA polymerase II transcription subunit 15a [Cajanus cajan]|uniref:mediator of RNA polymerase II transcription subunit 15a n=1 Tax=Cajanus cajan TaxID=3821 RepID=UPI0010FB6D27|nr:mediator of RNA polymerase II transcription subunit 15a [Cajanus cajan]